MRQYFTLNSLKQLQNDYESSTIEIIILAFIRSKQDNVLINLFNCFYKLLMLHLMAVAYFSNNNNIVSRLGYSRVRNS